ncbi:hypothetical protein BDZ45DRAFT_670414 [Acephala macrosclerotiorum]|nr:hypothetical protein BDZ45DRAFT_670414 [Acephala macrosclerotiorum]
MDVLVALPAFGCLWGVAGGLSKITAVLVLMILASDSRDGKEFKIVGEQAIGRRAASDVSCARVTIVFRPS